MCNQESVHIHNTGHRCRCIWHFLSQAGIDKARLLAQRSGFRLVHMCPVPVYRMEGLEDSCCYTAMMATALPTILVTGIVRGVRTYAAAWQVI